MSLYIIYDTLYHTIWVHLGWNSRKTRLSQRWLGGRHEAPRPGAWRAVLWKNGRDPKVFMEKSMVFPWKKPWSPTIFQWFSNDFPWFSMIYWSRIYDLIQKCAGFTWNHGPWPFQSRKWWLATRYFWGVCIIFSNNPTRFRHETSDNWIVAFWKLSGSKSHKIRGKNALPIWKSSRKLQGEEAPFDFVSRLGGQRCLTLKIRYGNELDNSYENTYNISWYHI